METALGRVEMAMGRYACDRGPADAASARANFSLFFDRGSLPDRSREGMLDGWNPLRPRAATGTVRTAVQRKATAYLRDTPLRGARTPLRRVTHNPFFPD